MTKYLDYINIDYHKIERLKNETQKLIPRKPTEEEKDKIRKKCPNIDMESVIIIRNSTGIYNCFAWSLGIDYTWINPPGDLEGFKIFYKTAADFIRHGFNNGLEWQANNNWQSLPPLDPDGMIDGWGTKDLKMTHASCLLIKNDYYPKGVWTSKLGEDYAITHCREGLKESNYGEVLVSFEKMPADVEIFDKIATSHFEAIKPSFFSRQDYEILYQKLDLLKLEEVGEKFSIAYQNWIDAIYEKIPFSSDTRDGAKLEEFKPLLDMGTDILPIVVFLIISNPSKNFRALVLYDALQKDDNLEIKYAPDDPRQFEGEVSRAAKTVKLWLKAQI